MRWSPVAVYRVGWGRGRSRTATGESVLGHHSVQVVFSHPLPLCGPMRSPTFRLRLCVRFPVSCSEPVWRSGKALVRLVSRGTSVGFKFRLSSLFKSCGRLWTPSCGLSFTVNETLKSLSPLPTLMHNHSGGDSLVIGIVSLLPKSVQLQVYNPLLFPHLVLGSGSPPAPLRRQLGVKHV